jgi:hypothetical protein
MQAIAKPPGGPDSAVLPRLAPAPEGSWPSGAADRILAAACSLQTPGLARAPAGPGDRRW